ncbi:MAG: hypothetical protein SNJ75_01285, partial [Gemmataceae bacterium]
DSRYWPEVQEALLLSLRCDPSEAVRWEAARALGRGLNCSKSTLRALTICVNASQEDGHPAEASPRVRAAARKALEHYVYHFERFVSKNIPLSPVGAEPRSASGSKIDGAYQTAMKSTPVAPIAVAYYKQVATSSWDQVLQDARRVLVLRQDPAISPSPVGSLFVIRRLLPPVLAQGTDTKGHPASTSLPTPVVAQRPRATSWWMLPWMTQTQTQLTTEEPSFASLLTQANPAATTTVSAPVTRGVSGGTRTSDEEVRERLVSLFRDSKEAGFREWAAYQLGKLPNAAEDAEVLRLLRHGAEKDVDRLVRLACSRSLAQLHKGGW